MQRNEWVFEYTASKLAEAAAKVRENDGWYQGLAVNPEARLKLNHDDWLFFFGQ